MGVDEVRMVMGMGGAVAMGIRVVGMMGFQVVMVDFQAAIVAG